LIHVKTPIAVKYPMRSAAIIISGIPQFGRVLQEQEKSCALSHSRDWGRDRNIPGPLVATGNSNAIGLSNRQGRVNALGNE
jgi:hypothetical protein